MGPTKENRVVILRSGPEINRLRRNAAVEDCVSRRTNKYERVFSRSDSRWPGSLPPLTLPPLETLMV